MKNLSIFIWTSFKNIRLDQTKNMILKIYFSLFLLAVLVKSNVSIIEFIFLLHVNTTRKRLGNGIFLPEGLISKIV